MRTRENSAVISKGTTMQNETETRGPIKFTSLNRSYWQETLTKADDEELTLLNDAFSRQRYAGLILSVRPSTMTAEFNTLLHKLTVLNLKHGLDGVTTGFVLVRSNVHRARYAVEFNPPAGSSQAAGSQRTKMPRS